MIAWNPLARGRQAAMTATGWDGDQGDWWVANAGRQQVMLSPLTSGLLAAAALLQGEAVLDVGCGCGELALRVAASVTPGKVLGIDMSSSMLALATQGGLALGLGNLSFTQGDAQSYSFPEASFDLVISQLGLMFFANPAAAFANLARATRPDGRLAFVCWQEMDRNEHVALPLRVVAAHVGTAPPGAMTGTVNGPDSLAKPGRIRELLTAAGYAQIDITSVEGPLRVGDDADDVVAYYQAHPMAKGCVAMGGPAPAAEVLAAIRSELLCHESPSGVFLASAAWLVTARRR